MAPAPRDGRWCGLRRRLTPELIELIAIGTFVLFVVWPFLQRSRMVVSFDGLAFLGPNLQVTLDTQPSGELPLWSRFIFGGVSHAGNTQTGFRYPLTVLGLPLPTTRAINVLTLLQLLLLAGGIVALCRWRLRLRSAGLVLGTAIVAWVRRDGPEDDPVRAAARRRLDAAWCSSLLHWLLSERSAVAGGRSSRHGRPAHGYRRAPTDALPAGPAARGEVRRARARSRPGAAARTAKAAALVGRVIALPHILLALWATDTSALGGGRTLEEIRAQGWLQGRSIVPGLPRRSGIAQPLVADPRFRIDDLRQRRRSGARAARTDDRPARQPRRAVHHTRPRPARRTVPHARRRAGHRSVPLRVRRGARVRPRPGGGPLGPPRVAVPRAARSVRDPNRRPSPPWPRLAAPPRWARWRRPESRSSPSPASTRAGRSSPPGC